MKAALAPVLTPFATLVLKLSRFTQLWAFCMAKAQFTKVGGSSVFLAPPEVRGTGEIELGEQALVYPGSYFETQEQGRIQIADGVVFSRGVHVVSYTSITIGAGTMIGEYTSIRDANHNPAAAGKSLRHSGHIAQPIRIGEQVWIGRGVMILPGVTIGHGATIAANAVVTRDVPAGCTVGGVPARLLKPQTLETQS